VTTLDAIARVEQGVAKIAQGNDNLQHAGNGQLDAATSEAASFMTIVQAIFVEGTDYMKKSAETRLAWVPSRSRP
jgi:hypothetical protein